MYPSKDQIHKTKQNSFPKLNITRKRLKGEAYWQEILKFNLKKKIAT